MRWIIRFDSNRPTHQCLDRDASADRLPRSDGLARSDPNAHCATRRGFGRGAYGRVRWRARTRCSAVRWRGTPPGRPRKNYKGLWGGFNPTADSVSHYEVNAMWHDGSWSGPIPTRPLLSHRLRRVGESCGTYVRESDGKVGELVRYQRQRTVRVVAAGTGKTLQTKAFLGAMPPECSNSVEIVSFINLPPPWRMIGDYVPPETINAYAVSVSTQTVK